MPKEQYKEMQELLKKAEDEAKHPDVIMLTDEEVNRMRELEEMLEGSVVTKED